MSSYIIHWKANPEKWPTDPAALLATWQQAAAGADAHLASGLIREIRWLNNTAGYAIVEAASKAEVMRICTFFYPWFEQEIDQTLSWEKGRDAILSAAREMAGGG